MNYQTMKIEDIIAWCQENKQVDWLKEELNKKVIVSRYSKRVKTTNEKGKTVWVADRNSEKIDSEEKITFIQVKKDFCEKFMPEIIPAAAEKKPTMYELVAAL